MLSYHQLLLIVIILNFLQTVEGHVQKLDLVDSRYSLNQTINHASLSNAADKCRRRYEPVSVTPNGHSVGRVTAADSIGQNAVATATPASTMYKYNSGVYSGKGRHDRLVSIQAHVYACTSAFPSAHSHEHIHARTHTSICTHAHFIQTHAHTHLSLPEGSTSC